MQIQINHRFPIFPIIRPIYPLASSQNFQEFHRSKSLKYIQTDLHPHIKKGKHITVFLFCAQHIFKYIHVIPYKILFPKIP